MTDTANLITVEKMWRREVEAAHTYKLLAELSGFGPVLVPKVELLVGQNATVPITLSRIKTAFMIWRRHTMLA